jgi:hypothetical protein
MAFFGPAQPARPAGRLAARRRAQRELLWFDIRIVLRTLVSPFGKRHAY